MATLRIKIARFISNRLDLIGSILGILAGFGLLIVGNKEEDPATSEMGLALVIGGVLYLVLRHTLVKPISLSITAPPKAIITLNILIVSLMATSVFLLHSLYRPQLYFILLAIVAVAIVMEALYADNRIHVVLTLAHILLLSAILRAGLYYESPGLIGSDGWLHWATVDAWVQNQHVTLHVPNLSSNFSTYYDFPIMHLLVIATGSVTGLDFKNSLFLSVGWANVISIIFIFLLAERLMGRRQALLAALFLGVSQYHIAWGATLIPMSLGLVFFAILLYLIFSGAAPSRGQVLLFSCSLLLRS